MAGDVRDDNSAGEQKKFHTAVKLFSSLPACLAKSLERFIHSYKTFFASLYRSFHNDVWDIEREARKWVKMKYLKSFCRDAHFNWLFNI